MCTVYIQQTFFHILRISVISVCHSYEYVNSSISASLLHCIATFVSLCKFLSASNAPLQFMSCNKVERRTGGGGCRALCCGICSSECHRWHLTSIRSRYIFQKTDRVGQSKDILRSMTHTLPSCQLMYQHCTICKAA